MTAAEFTKEHFLNFWPSAYQETWEGYAEPRLARDAVHGELRRLAPGGTALDVGCGSGIYTINWLLPLFTRVVAVDVIDKPRAFDGQLKVRYIQVGGSDYALPGVEDESVDFVWSFGVFCHFPVSARRRYYQSIHRVLNRGGCGVVMEPNFKRHPLLATEPNAERFAETSHPMMWFYGDAECTRRAVESAGLKGFTDLLPEFRDTLGHFHK